MTLRELNRTLLERQLLLQRKRTAVPKAVQRLVALQAQYAPSPYVALWSRVEGFRKEQLTADARLVKARTLRGTLHVMAFDDYPSIAASAIESRRGRSEGVPFVRDGVVGPWPHTKPPPVIPWREPLPGAQEASTRVVHAYLAGYGPATRADIEQFTGFRVRQIAPALDGLRELEGGLFDLPRARCVSGDVPAPVRFLPAFDSIILAHRDRSRILPPEYVEVVINKKNATTKNTFTVDGFVAGAWRVERRKLVVEPFAPLPLRARREVDAEGERLLAWYLA